MSERTLSSVGYSRNAHNGQCHTRLKPAAQGSVWASHVLAGTHILEPSSVLFQQVEAEDMGHAPFTLMKDVRNVTTIPNACCLFRMYLSPYAHFSTSNIYDISTTYIQFFLSHQVGWYMVFQNIPYFKTCRSVVIFLLLLLRINIRASPG